MGSDFDPRSPLPYGGYCNNPSCNVVHVGGSTEPTCFCGSAWSDAPGKTERSMTDLEAAEKYANQEKTWPSRDCFIHLQKEAYLAGCAHKNAEVERLVLALKDIGNASINQPINDLIMRAVDALAPYAELNLDFAAEGTP
jgi:hypothetical protein